ncbi:hemocytin [Daktulosphaira vitifoliae]|uniref:hemocytin n=1 Tax=Daktulosphaira vitifoliae TaxID=58002 RepID=UPI0021AAA099|nr:hemocytin [Daktulosphaira vitifoliae]
MSNLYLLIAVLISLFASLNTVVGQKINYTDLPLEDDDEIKFLTFNESDLPNDDPSNQNDDPVNRNQNENKTNVIKPERRNKIKGKVDKCKTTFQAPNNSQTLCSSLTNTCRATCNEGYKFPKGNFTLVFICEGDKYKIKGTNLFDVPFCQPICDPPCENNGQCEKPNTCKCSENYAGEFCQIKDTSLYHLKEHKEASSDLNQAPSNIIFPDEFPNLKTVVKQSNSSCHGFPHTPMNSYKKCKSDVCTISCLEGHKFSDGTSVTDLFCKNGVWLPGNNEWLIVPNCVPICEPSCLNGGNCISPNTCQCPTDFKGPQCQYPESSCDIMKLNFNGNFKCSDNDVNNNCTLWCPQGSILEPYRSSEIEYTCLYETGSFSPKHIPQCVFNNQLTPVKVITSVIEVTETYHIHPSSCITWGYGNYKTFDGRVYSIHSDCTFTLISDVKSNLFQVQAQTYLGSISHINIFVGGSEYAIKKNNDNSITLVSNKISHTIPIELADIGVEILGGQTVLTNLRNANVKIFWKPNGVLQVDAGIEIWNSTEGLCGNMDGNPENDLMYKNVPDFASKWLVNGFNEVCERPIEEIIDVTKEVFYKAELFCSILKKETFKNCTNKQLNTEAYIEVCKMEYSHCILKNDENCGCNSIAIYVQDCFDDSRRILWRDERLCPFQCPSGKVYSQCLPAIQKTCSLPSDLKILNNNEHCEEGCICPPGSVENNGQCISKDQCPCKMGNIFYKSGDIISKECNKCTCIGGEWSCTKATCRAECYAVGDPHYKTFDGLKFNFMGSCSYYLIVLPEFAIEAENIPCDGTLSQEFVFEMTPFSGKGTCTKSLTIHIGNTTKIKLGQNKIVTVNGEIIDKLPVSVFDLAYIRHLSTFFLQIVISNGIEVQWDGETRLHIYANPELIGKTKGLCGTFNGNQKDDFLTPEGDYEIDAVAFANKWKTKESCKNSDLEVALQSPHPCDINIQHKYTAESYCNNITGKLFSECHILVDPSSYYEDCLYDMCSCHPGKFSRCYCQILATYAMECNHQGLNIDWRYEARQCGIQCPAGQQYNSCGNSCQRTCHDMSIINSCKSSCVEGCYCPLGSTLSEFGECIPMSECPCYYNGQKYNYGQKRMDGSTNDLQLCTCKSAAWDCKHAEPSEIELWKDVKTTSCSHQKHLEFTECEPVEPITCYNMHDPPQLTPAVCYSGCICKNPYVLDSYSKECVLPNECPCHHGGKSYSNNETFFEGCNICECQLGKWKCSNNECNGVCSAWGDSHFQTFDSHYYDFQGTCEYILAKGTLSDYESFVTSIDVVPCGSTGASCIKSITLSVGSGLTVETVNMRNKNYLPKLNRIIIKEVGLFIVAEVPDMGIVIHWDKGTRVHLQLDPKWKSHVNGLCGNYNDNQMDDFITPYGGIPEVSSTLFGDSWKLQSYCSLPTDVRDACLIHPHRREWANKKCGLLKSSLFKSCHPHVLVENYLQRCIYDTCACDQGGDCECLCTAIAAYAQECSIHGINIKWRSQDLCPIQCENGTFYESCIPPCSFKSCDDFISNTELCDKKLCVEGCVRTHCPQGQVYSNYSSKLCVPINSCKIPCQIVGINEVYNEGDVILEDECHRCFCSKNKKICKGQPCDQTIRPYSTIDEIYTTTDLPFTSTTKLSLSTQITDNKCISGWSKWIKKSFHNSKLGVQSFPSIEEFKNIELNINKEEDLGICSFENIIDVQCRSLKAIKGIKEKFEQIDCTVDNGIMCNNDCKDIEIRINCDCGDTEDTMQNKVIKNSRNRTITRLVCPVGLKCKVMCNQMCQSFENSIKTTKVCDSSQNCISGCVSELEKLNSCPEGWMWRDKDTCVQKNDCTCYSRNGTLVKPGGIFKEDWCTICQCINNAYVCDDSSCNIHAANIEKHEYTTSPVNGISIELGHEYTTQQYFEKTQLYNIMSTVISTAPSTMKPIETTSTKSYTDKIIINELETTSENTLYVPLSVSPPTIHCDNNQVESISSNLGPKSFNASSWYSPNTEPYYSQMDSADNGFWRPAESKENEYLQIDIGYIESIYGVELAGNPSYDEYVTSYIVAFSTDGIGFSYVSYNGIPKIFRGPYDHKVKEKQIFFLPIEARYIRIIPKSWHNEIAIKISLLGCPIKSTTLEFTTYTTVRQTLTSMCSEPMGIESGLLNDGMITVSSSLNNDFHSHDLSLSSNKSWIPFTASTSQWIQIDFTGPRIITGIESKGNPPTNSIGNAWIEAFKIVYSNDLINWNKILDSRADEKIFTGNFDSDNAHKTYFDTPIRARYIRIYPEKWQNKPALRLEILGCFEKYMTAHIFLNELTEKPTIMKGNCNICPGIISYDCICSPEKWWNGESCSLRSECPCVIGVMTYQVGTVYDLENCQQCICTLGGIPSCSHKICPPCPPGKISVTSISNCDCTCEYCKNGTRLCQTSNICLNESFWCNGIQDCPDDEVNCPSIITTTPMTTTEYTEVIQFNIPVIPNKVKKVSECPEIKCPEGKIAKILNTIKFKSLKSNRKVRSAEVISEDPWPSPFSPVTNLAASLKKSHRDPVFSTKGNVIRKGSTSYTSYNYGGIKSENQQPICKQWICEEQVKQVECKTPPLSCPEGYFLQMTPNKNEICPVYTCVSSYLEEKECEIDGRIFRTFDGITYKYEVCDHIIVRDRVYKKWMIKQIRRCPYVGACQQSLWLQHMNHIIEFFPNMTTFYDGYQYTINQLQVIGSQTEQFAVKQVQTNYVIFASTLGFNLIWQVNGNVKIKLNAFYTGRVDGLCGFFDNNPKNDKVKRDGNIAATTSEFGISWADSSQLCEAKICPVYIQKEAIKACEIFKSQPLSRCGDFVNIDEFIMKCVEKICSCSENSANDASECRCKAISGLVTQCYTMNSSVELSDWRLLHDCPVNCHAPFVYKDCFNKACEPNCDNLLQNDPCPQLPGVCFPGCYCPDGYIREYGSCIKPSKCRNCICEGSGTSHYTTFDKVDYDHKQNCSYILVKTTKENDLVKPGFTIIETTGKCSNPLFNNGICVQNISIIQTTNNLSLSYNEDASKILVFIDDNEITKLPFSNNWMLLTELPGKSVTVNLPNLELEIVFMVKNQGFSIKLPSHLYYGKTEGLCGSCNGDSTDDMATPDGNIPNNIDEFVISWKTSLTGIDKCEAIKNEENKEKCKIPAPDMDPCLKLMDIQLFGQCHPIVDVEIYIRKCHLMLCEGLEGVFCHSLESYVRECQSFGVCLNWRSPNLCPYTCPQGLIYQACTTGCEETCDNYKVSRSGGNSCNGHSTEMCVCPSGQVFKNSSCVDEARCEPCDNENHFVGDSWLVDKCTTCTCSPGLKTIHCERKPCPTSSFSICQIGYKSVKDEQNSDECCDVFKCIPEENVVQNCTDIIMPVCAKDQIVKMELSTNGCKKFICECIPRDQCHSTLPDQDVELLPGMVNVMNYQGCCPTFQAICRSDTCPDPKPCDMYYKKINIDNHSCCPHYKCELPNNTCIYEYEWIASAEGGERKRYNDEKTVDLKQNGDTWEDGPCRTCLCDMNSRKGICNKIECPSSPVSLNYVIIAKFKYGQCCPIYKKEACIYHGKIFNVGSEWSSSDPCKTLSCKQDSNDEVYIHESEKNCNTECPLGWIYDKPSSSNCCGSCVQVNCVMQNKIYAENETWTYDNNCTTHICTKSEFNEFNIVSVYQSCPNIGDCPENKIYIDGCCERCNNTEIPVSDKVLCAPESLPLNQTVGLITEENPFHDFCANIDAIVGFTECRGMCDSYTYFNKKTIKHDSKCQCCQAIRYEKLSVPLICKDGHTYKKTVAVPSSCSCASCSGESFSIKKSRKL